MKDKLNIIDIFCGLVVETFAGHGPSIHTSPPCEPYTTEEEE
jgi:hypothetical protein